MPRLQPDPAQAGIREREAVIDVSIQTIGPMNVTRIRHVGSYSGVGPCFERLFRWAAGIGASTGRVLTLSYDDPAAVPPERLRSDACVEMHTDEEPPPGISMGTVGGGRYAVYRLKGPYKGIANAYGRLFEEWLPASGETMVEGPCLALYRNTPSSTSAENLVTDLCLPVNDRTAG